MARALFVSLLASSLVLLATQASAQVAGRRPVAAGDVTGVELQLEGSLEATRGGTLRWAIVAYEVVGLDRLRPAPGAEIRLATSLRRRSNDDSGPLVVTADARGRAVLELPIPDDAPDAFGATLDVAARRGVTRRFELRVTTRDPRTLVLFGAESAPERGRLPVFGRYAAGSAGLADATVRLVLFDGRGPLGAPVEVRTDAAGLFAHTFRIPRDAEGALRVDALGPPDSSDAERRTSATWSAMLAASSEPALVVQVLPARHLARSNERVPVEVMVRRADGRPVPETRLRIGGGPIPLLEEEDAQRTRERFAVTDARGRATLTYEAPRVGGSHADLTITVQAGRAGVGRGVGNATIRVSDRVHASRLGVEGGVLVPSLAARAFVRVTTMDGAPARAGLPVVIEGPRVGRSEGTTEDGGVVAFDLRVGPPKDGDRCGGLAATDVVVTIAGEASEGRCLPVDPDAAVRVRLGRALVVAGQSVDVAIERSAAASGMPVALLALHRDASGRLSPLTTGVLDARTERTTLTLPETTRGEVLVRARPLAPGDREARGGFAALWAVGALPSPMSAEAVGSVDAIVANLAGGARASSLALAVPYGDDARVRAQLQALASGPFADLRGAALTNLSVAALLAERTPMDVAAPSVLRGRGTLEAAPEPTSPETHGLLRDPWRASARFVEGRLALLFRAIEARIEAAVPEQMDEVAVERNGRFTFNRQLLASLAEGSLGSEGATGLGGEPLTIERLEALDRAFGYDAVARRITRERLFTLLLALRQFVQENTLDLAWTRPGDPTLWIERLKHRYVAGGQIRPGQLVDGWGRPFRLVATARARFANVQPVVGFELVSAGPDGRFGNGDDVFDPTARVLPSGSLYGDAVGEDALVARLRGVELGRATLALAAGAFGAPQPRIAPPPDESRPATALGELPPRHEHDPHALALMRPTRPTSAVIARGADEPLRLPVGTEPRTWRVLALGVDAAGNLALATDATRAGAPVLADLALPSRLRVGEPLRFPLHLTNVTTNEAQYTLAASSEGIATQLDSAVTLPPGETRSLDVRLEGRASGRHPVAVEVRAGDRLLQRVDARVGVDAGGHPIRRRATGLAGSFEAELAIPSRAQGTQSRLVVVAPNALGADPDLVEVRREDPALVAWAETLAGRSLDETLRARLIRATGPDGSVEGAETSLSTAAAVVALAAIVGEDGEPDADAQAARARATSRIGGLPPFPDRDGVAGRVRMMAASLAALATSGAIEPVGSYDPSDGDVILPRPNAHDPVANAIRIWMPQLRRTLRDRPGHPTLLARAAGALLLADARDGHGRAMYATVRDGLADDGLVAGGELSSLDDRLAGSLAFALAAHQVGDTETASRVLRAAALHGPALARRGGELTFWWLACGAYGALGAAPESVRVGGREVALERGVATVDLGLAAGASRNVHVEANGAVVARVEAVFAMPFEERSEARMALTLSGSVGRVGELAALELSVKAHVRRDAPVLDVQLPAGVEGDERLLASLRANGMVREAEAREPGFVRLHLVSLEPQQEVAIPLPLRWRASGSVRGLAVVAYDASAPQDMTVLPARVMEVGAAE